MGKIEKYLDLTLETDFSYDNFTDAELTKDYKNLKKISLCYFFIINKKANN